MEQRVCREWLRLDIVQIKPEITLIVFKYLILFGWRTLYVGGSEPWGKGVGGARISRTRCQCSRVTMHQSLLDLWLRRQEWNQEIRELPSVVSVWMVWCPNRNVLMQIRTTRETDRCSKIWRTIFWERRYGWKRKKKEDSWNCSANGVAWAFSIDEILRLMTLRP